MLKHVAFIAMVLSLGALSAITAQELDTVRCERATDLKHWRCEATCAAGETGIATCPTLSAWGACGRQVLHQACGIAETTPAVACVRKVVLAGQNLDQLKTACEQGFAGFDEVLKGPLEEFPGLVYRPTE